MSYSVARRTNEIGIRMALGAEQGRVLRMVLGEVLLLIAIGLVIGAAAALSTTRFMSSLLYGVTPTDPVTLALAAGCRLRSRRSPGIYRRGELPGSIQW